MGDRMLSLDDEGVHAPGPESNWNESRYVDFHDPVSGVAGWLRTGMRPNEGRAEMSVCAYLPDGRTAFFFERAPITGNGLTAGGQSWGIGEPYLQNSVRYEGPVLLLDDAWTLTDPRAAYRDSPRAEASFDLAVSSAGLAAVMGSDQDHIDRIFLPGQADWHYQHLARTVGTIRIGDETFAVDGRGGKDHSWGPRNWHAKIYLRWLICAGEDGSGFMLVRAVGPTKQTRSGFIWDDGGFQLVDDFAMTNTYAGAPHFELRQTEVTIHAGRRICSAVGTPSAWLPLRHRQPGADGAEAILRIVKSPASWVRGDGRTGTGHCEWHDRLADGVPVGLAD